MNSRQFLLFVAAGGTAALANFGSRLALSHFMGYVPAIVLAYLIGMTTAFLLNRAFVFTGAVSPVGQQAWRFVLVNLAAVVQTIVISLALARFVLPWLAIDGHAETIAHAIGVIVPVFTSYLGHKHFSFAGTTREAPP